jgi:3-oxoacyl-(acyl-carrier-protein) synthase
MNSSIAITAGISGELDGQASIGSAIRAIQRGRAVACPCGGSAPSDFLAGRSPRIPFS